MQDLWAEFAGEALPTEEAGRGGGLRQRRLTEQAVLMALRAWLLQEYMIPYGASLGATRIFQRCYWIDGLGNFRAATQIVPTPVLEETEAASKRRRKKASVPVLPPALQPVEAVARQLTQLDRPITLHGFVFDGKGGKRKAADEPELQAQNGTQPVEALVLPKAGGLLPSNWPELAPALLSTLEQSAAVFLLNPLKDGLFRYADLLPLYQRTAPTELFLWLSHKQIETRLLPGLRAGKGAAALTNVLRSDRWKILLAKEGGTENPEPIINGLIDLLAESMRPHFLSVQHLTFPVYTRPALVEEAPYSLLFATRRQDSLYSLNDAVCRRARRLLTESQQGVLNEAWFTTQREEQATAHEQALYQEALSLGKAHRIRRWPDLRYQLLLAHFGQSTLQEYDQIITTLLARGEVRCDWRKRNPETTETPIPGNEDLLLWPR
jgi:hypothetical protein